MKRFQLVMMVGLAASLLAFAADEKKGWKLPPETAKLQRGPGVELVTAQCVACHSLDYISTQPPMSRAAWAGTVTKMKEKYGAPVAPERLEAVIEYLVKNYGNGQ